MNSKNDTLDVADALSSLLQTDVEHSHIVISLASITKDQDIPELQQVQISDDLAREFRDVVENVLGCLRRQLKKGDLVLRPYDLGSKPDAHEIEYIQLSDHASIGEQVKALASITNLALFRADDDFISGLRFYVIIAQPQRGDPIYFFRAYSKSKELHRSRSFAALFSEGHYDTVREPIFLFDASIDCLASGDFMYIRTPGNFQRIFRFFEYLRKTAEETLETIERSIPIANFEEFKEACEGHLQKLAKLKNISQKPYLRRITIKDIKRVIGMFDLKIDFTGDGGEEKLLFDPSNKWELLRLLDDDYLSSVMTDQNYEVTGKRVRF